MKNLKTLATALIVGAALALSACGAIGAASRAVCDTAAIVPDEALALTAATSGFMTGGTGAAAAKYAATRPISRLCNAADEEVDLIKGEFPAAGVGAGEVVEVSHADDYFHTHDSDSPYTTPDGNDIYFRGYHKSQTCIQAAPGIVKCFGG